jgi:hypothetical protein
MTTQETPAKTAAKRTRNPMTEFGLALRSFVRGVHPVKLALKVSEKIGEPDKDKTEAAISNMIRIANLTEGVLGVRRKALVEAVLASVVELDPDMELKGQRLAKMFQFEAVSSKNRDSANNWLVKLKAGEEIKINDGPEGAGVYRLLFVRPVDPDLDETGEEGSQEVVTIDDPAVEEVTENPVPEV